MWSIFDKTQSINAVSFYTITFFFCLCFNMHKISSVETQRNFESRSLATIDNRDKMDDSSLFQGDIIPSWHFFHSRYGKDFAEEMVEKGIVEKPNAVHARGTIPLETLWNNDRKGGLAFINIYIDDGYKSNTKKTIKKAIRKLQTKAKIVRFKFLKKSQLSGKIKYIHFFHNPDKGCSTYIGTTFGELGPHYVNLYEKQSSGEGHCIWTSTIQHELLHVLGFDHEQSRRDRDDYVTINWDNIRESSKHNFAKADPQDSLGSPYDYASIMHYSPYSFAIDKSVPTIFTKNGQEIKDLDYASKQDILQLRLMYQCDFGPRKMTEYKQKRCTTSCKCWKGQKCTNSDQCQYNLKCVSGRCVRRTTKPTIVPNFYWLRQDDNSDSGYSTSGIMFDVKAKDQDIIVKNFASYLRGNNGVAYPIQIFTKTGTHIGFEADSSAWTKIADFDIYENEPIDIFYEQHITPVTILARQKQAFYITTKITGEDVRPFRIQEKDLGLNNIASQDKYLKLYDGSGFYDGKFGETVWDCGSSLWGGVKYSLK